MPQCPAPSPLPCSSGPAACRFRGGWRGERAPGRQIWDRRPWQPRGSPAGGVRDPPLPLPLPPVPRGPGETGGRQPPPPPPPPRRRGDARPPPASAAGRWPPRPRRRRPRRPPPPRTGSFPPSRSPSLLGALCVCVPCVCVYVRACVEERIGRGSAASAFPASPRVALGGREGRVCVCVVLCFMGRVVLVFGLADPRIPRLPPSSPRRQPGSRGVVNTVATTS